jgi:hypothetical protein
VLNSLLVSNQGDYGLISWWISSNITFTTLWSSSSSPP